MYYINYYVLYTCMYMCTFQGSRMSFLDFKDFPIFAVENETFSNEILKVCPAVHVQCVCLSSYLVRSKGKSVKRKKSKRNIACLLLLKSYTK